MALHKYDAAKTTALLLPMLFLGAYVARAPLPLPAALLPERRYLALAAGADAASSLRSDRGRAREAFASLSGGLAALPGPSVGGEAWAEAAAALPEAPSLSPVLADLATLSPGSRRIRLVSGRALAAAERVELDALARARGLPLAIVERRPGTELPLLALSWRRARRAERLGFELLLSPAARELRRLQVRSTGREAELLWRGPGSALPEDLCLRLSARLEARAGSAGAAAPPFRVELEAEFPDGSLARRGLDLGVESEEEARVLVVSDKTARNSFIEGLYPTRRLPPGEAAKADLGAYELVVLDGLPLKTLPRGLEDGLVDLAGRRGGSLLFVADSPEFGKRGDAPRLEALLPVSLMPRSLKDLPDLAVLLLIDVSGSMFGDKLSLAKVTGLELLRNLKPGDRVGMMLFSDERRWVYDFQVNSSIAAAPTLDPIAARGGTDLAAALREGLARLERQSLSERHVVVVSDGVTKPADFRALAERAKAMGATISTMGIGKDLDRPLLEKLALQSGGRFYAVAGADEIPALLFEDRKSAARPQFAQGSIPILALNGARAGLVRGMAIYAAAEPASVLFANEYGDPLFASREYGNRAVMLFASDLYGTYTGEFFSEPDAAGALRDRLDALFQERPLEISVHEAAAGLGVSLRGEAFVEPLLRLTRPGESPLEAPFGRSGEGLWTAAVAPPALGRWRATVFDRGSAVASLELPLNGGFSGVEAGGRGEPPPGDSRGAAFALLRSDGLWLLLFFAASLGATVVLRIKR